MIRISKDFVQCNHIKKQGQMRVPGSNFAEFCSKFHQHCVRRRLYLRLKEVKRMLVSSILALILEYDVRFERKDRSRTSKPPKNAAVGSLTCWMMAVNKATCSAVCSAYGAMEETSWVKIASSREGEKGCDDNIEYKPLT